jgi:phosphate transport system substrate-binding protein
MRSKPIAVVAVALLLLAAGLLAACGEPVATLEPEFLEAAGSTTMAQLVSELADGFAERSPLVSIDVTGLGTEFGLDEFAAGRADFAFASWLPEGLDSRWQATAIARDGIAIIVHPNNAVDGLGLLQLQDLFSGHVHEWRAVGGERSQGSVQVVSREAGSGTRSAFEVLVMDGQRVTPLAVVAPSSEAVIEYVATHPEAIGYVSMGGTSSRVKVLSIEGELPTSRSAGQGSYPLSRELWLVTEDSPAKAVEAFRRFGLSPAGQEIVGRNFGRVR